MAEISVLDVAAYIFDFMGGDKNHKNRKSLKVHYLLYYCQAWHMAINHEPLFLDDLCAWSTGPISPLVYDWQSKRTHVKELGNYRKIKMPQMTIIEYVLDRYYKTPTATLAGMCMQEKPWIEARNNLNKYKQIDERILNNIYSDREGEFPQFLRMHLHRDNAKHELYKKDVKPDPYIQEDSGIPTAVCVFAILLTTAFVILGIGLLMELLKSC